LPNKSLLNSFSDLKKVIVPIFVFFNYLQMYFCGGYAAQLSGRVPLRKRLGYRQVLAGLALSSQTVGSTNMTKSELCEFTSTGKMHLSTFDQMHSAKSEF
jgi:hypothetical protein